MGWNWNPISWAEDAWHAFTGAGSEVGRWVIHVVEAAAGAVERDVLDVFHVADQAYQDSLSFVAQEANNAVGVADQVGAMASAAIGEVAREARGLTVELFARAEQGLGYVLGEAEALAAGAERAARAELDTVVRDLVDPVVHFVDHADAWWWHLLDGWWHTVDRDVIHPLEHELDRARHDVAEAGHWIAHEGEYAYHLVTEAADWLEWMAVHALHDVEALPGEVARDLSWHGVLSWLGREEEHLGADVEALARRVFA